MFVVWYLPKGLTHQEMSTTDPGRHTAVIDIKEKTVPEAQNIGTFPTNKYAAFQTKVIDNDRVVIWDCAWAMAQNQSHHSTAGTCSWQLPKAAISP